MKILITGATGLVGMNLINKALDQGHSINFLTTKLSKIHSINGCKGFYWNPSKGQIDLKAFEGVSQLVNLAGVSISKPWTKKNKIKIIESRIFSLRILHNTLVDLNLKLDGIVSASAIGYYPSSINISYKESDICSSTSFLHEVVKKWENSIDELEIHSKYLSKLRIGLVLSDNGGILSKLLIPIKLGLGSAFGDGFQWQSWIHIDDLSSLILYSIENKFNGVYNAVAPNSISQNQLIKSLGNKMNRPIFLPNIPKFVLKTIMGDRSQLILDSQKVISDKVIKCGYKFKYQEFDDAIKDLKL